MSNVACKSGVDFEMNKGVECSSDGNDIIQLLHFLPSYLVVILDFSIRIVT
jgi:hypothetical protein